VYDGTIDPETADKIGYHGTEASTVLGAMSDIQARQESSRFLREEKREIDLWGELETSLTAVELRRIVKKKVQKPPRGIYSSSPPIMGEMQISQSSPYFSSESLIAKIIF